MNYRSRMFVGLSLVVFCLSASSFAQMPGMGNGSGSFGGYQGHQVNNDLIVPQVVVGQHYTTNLLLLNMGNSQMMSWVPIQNLTTTGKVYFYRQDGTGMPISVNGGAPASEFSFSLDPSKSAYYVLSSSGSDTPGWALIDVDEPASGSGALAWSRQHNWQVGTESDGANRLFCVETWLELYFVEHDRAIVDPAVRWLSTKAPNSPAGAKVWYLEKGLRYVDSLYGAAI